MRENNYEERKAEYLTALADCRTMVRERDLRNDLAQIGRDVSKILDRLVAKPELELQAHRYVNLELPHMIKAIQTYVDLRKNQVKAGGADEAKKEIRQSIALFARATEQMVAKLYEDEMMDVSTDLDVVKMMMEQDGLMEGLDDGHRFELSETREEQSEPPGESSELLYGVQCYRPGEYWLDEIFYETKDIMLAVILRYVREHPGITAEELMEAFPPELQGTYGTVRLLSDVKQSYVHPEQYFHIRPPDQIKTTTGICVVCNQWDDETIKKALKR